MKSIAIFIGFLFLLSKEGYTQNSDGISFEIIAGNGKNPTITGNSKFDNENIPEVKSYEVNGRQRAILLKQKLSSD